jgi:hypothetical protein
MAVAAFLTGAAVGAFFLVVIGVHKGDRARHLSDAPDTQLAAPRRFSRLRSTRRSWRLPDHEVSGRNPARDGTKTARFLALVAEQHGPLAGIPVPRVSRISAALAPQVGLNAGAARTALRRAVLAAQDGGIR